MLRSLAAITAIAAASCHTAPLATPSPRPDGETILQFDDVRGRPLDLLFVIDDSTSMESEQEKLRSRLPSLLDVLAAAPGGLPDLHVAVVTTDQGACTRNGFTLGRLRSGCGLKPGARFIASTPSGQRNWDGELADVFGCLALPGVGGCGFEQPLRAISAALDNPENAGFLRDEAVLGIMILGDEDDCSGPPGDFFTMMTPETGSFRCAARGHLCGGAPPPPMTSSRAFSTCVAAPDGGGALYPVDDLVRDLRRRKHDPRDIVVSVLTGIPGAPATASYEIGPSESMLERGRIEVRPICEDGKDTAAPALRLSAFAGAFGRQGHLRSICSADFDEAVREFGRNVTDGQRCIAAATLWDTDPDAPGIQAECVVTETVIAREQPTALPSCRPGGPRPCWRLDASASCPSDELFLAIDRDGDAPHTTNEVRCRTCVGPDDPACRR